MIIREKRKDILRFLLHRWQALSRYGALEIIQDSQRKIAEQCGVNIVDHSEMQRLKPTKQIELIKQQILKFLPEANFITKPYEPPAELQPHDFVELYINHQKICSQHIIDLMDKKSIK